MLEINTDRVKGALWGHAFGDALGLEDEFQSKAMLALKYVALEGPSYFRRVERGEVSWPPGDWSDDTTQMLLIVDSYLRDGEVDPQDFALRLSHWLKTDGRGSGGHTRAVLNHPAFLSDPFVASQRVWEASEKQAAPNGAVMRTTGVGLLRPWDIAWTRQAAEDYCRVTHSDPRCIASCQTISHMVALLVCGASPNEALLAAQAEIPESLESLQLDEGLGNDCKRAPIGYTKKAEGAGIWALDQLAHGRGDPLTILQQIILEGGDTDTNAAVAGGLLGAAVGFNRLPLLAQSLYLGHRMGRQYYGLLDQYLTLPGIRPVWWGNEDVADLTSLLIDPDGDTPLDIEL